MHSIQQPAMSVANAYAKAPAFLQHPSKEAILCKMPWQFRQNALEVLGKMPWQFRQNALAV